MKSNIVAYMLLRAIKGRNPFTLMSAFVTYVRPILEYASPVWSPHIKRDVVLLEKVQRAFTRRVLAWCSLLKLSYPERLKFFALDSLETRRVKCDLILMYKIFRGLLDVNVNHFFPTPLARTRSMRSNGL
jgi:ribonuclease P/MRP protein subunit RPP40